MTIISTSRDERRAETAGIEKERVDPYTLQIIDQLFPGHHGIQFLAGILRQASVKQLALPELALPEVTDVAVITVQSIRTLAQLIGFSYDTTEKYIVVLSHLRLLHKKRYRRQIILHFPLCRCQVPEPEALESLDYRPKVTSFAGQVKRRIVLLRTSVKIPPPSLTGFQSNPQCFVPQLVEDIRKILQQEVDSEIGSRLLPRIEGAVRYRCTQSQSLLSEQKGDSETMLSGQQSRLLHQKDDSLTGERQQESCLFEQKGDSEIGVSGQQSLLSVKGDSETMLSGQQSRLLHQKGDSLRGKEADTASESPFSRQKDDFQRFAPAASFNDNVITTLNEILKEGYDSDNDAVASSPAEETYSPSVAAKIGRKLALFLENSPENTGGFVAKCKVCTPTVIQAAVIDVLIHQAFPTVDPADDRGRPRNKAKWFHETCKKYAMPGAHIPAFIEKWLRTDLYWQDLEAYWKEITEQLDEAGARYRRYMIADADSANLVRQWLRGDIEQSVLDEALQTSALSQDTPSQRTLQPLTPAPVAANGTPLVVSQPVAQVQKTWMDEDEAQILAEEILRDAGPFGVSKAVTKQEHGVHVVALTWLGTTFAMKTPQQWRAHFENVRPEFELRMQKKGERNGSTR